MRGLLLSAAVLTMAAPAFAADMGLPAAPVYKAPVMAPLYDWTGFYVGGHIGWAWSTSSGTTVNSTNGALVSIDSGSSNHFHGGGQIGYNYMFPSRVVIGVEADISSGASDTTTSSNAAGNVVSTHQSKTDVSGTVRGRLGYAIDNVLFYATGGWAWTSASDTRSQVLGTVGNATPGTVESVGTDRNGWTVGGGVSYAFLRNWNVFAEYRYTGWDSITFTFPVAQRTSTTSSSTNAVRVGFNYKF